MTARRILDLAVAAVLLLILLPAMSLSQDKEVPPASAKIEAELLDLLSAKGSADFIVRMAEQADLSAAYQMRDWQARGQYVYNSLKQVSEHSQAQVKGMLSKQGLRFQSFIAGNELYVWAGDLNTATALARLPDVVSVRATRTYYLAPIVGQDPTPQSNPQAVTDWGITDTRADQFWGTFGRQGDGITVANIDTGVQWHHPALVNQFKCPGDPSNPACWADPSNICGGSACDNDGHGTHTMGTMVADDNPSLPYIAGMAPSARWIACKGCEDSSCSDYALNACADWILAPGGEPANRPHVVNNSWGGDGCDTWYLSKVQAWRAAGTFPAFSAGNSYLCDSMGSPGDFQESFGSASHRSDRVISGFSSKGPSCFGDYPYTKPNISAPGENICSTVPGGWDCYYSGTSMASPHSAGAVALLWSCNPALVGQIDQTFEILQYNAAAAPPGECGAPEDGEGNFTYGYGYLDVYRAGLTWCGETGTLEGHVTDADTSAPMAGALIKAARQGGGVLTAFSDADGYYAVTAIAGTYEVTASKYGHLPQTVTGVVLLTDTVTTQDFALEPAPMHTVEGTVTDATTRWPLYARIDIDGYPSSPVWTNPETGYYSVELIAGVEYAFHVDGWTPGYLTDSRTVGPLTGDQTQDFQLQADLAACTAPGYQLRTLSSQDFEASDGGFTTYGYGGNPTSWQWGTPTSGPGNAHSGTSVWATNLGGTYSNSEDSYLESPDIDMSALAGQGFVLSWWQWLQTEGCCDFGEIQVSSDGGSSWSTVYGPDRGNVDLIWAQHKVMLDSSYAVRNLRIRFHLGTDSSVTYAGYYVDDLAISGDCQPQPGGLVMGNVYDANTTAPLVGAQVSNDNGGSTTTGTTPGDPALDDAFYTLFSPAGDHQFTATVADGYSPAVRLVPVVAGDAVREDFALPAGWLSFLPPSLEVTLDMGQSMTVPSLLSNNGGAATTFELQEKNRGFQPTRAGGPFAEPKLLVSPERVHAANTKGLEMGPTPAGKILSAGHVIQSWQAASQSAAWGLAYTAGDSVWVGEGWGVNAIYEYDSTGTPTGRAWPYPWGPYYGPADDAFNWNTGMVWTLDVDLDYCLHEMDPDSGYTGNTICGPWGTSQRGVAYDPGTDTWFVGGWNEGVVYRIDSSGTLLDSASVDLPIAGLAYNPETQHLFVMANYDPNPVYVLDTAAGYGLIGQFYVSQGFGSYAGAGLEFDCAGNLWAVDQDTNTIYQFESGEAADLCAADVPWLAESPITGTVGSNIDLPVEVMFDARMPNVTQPGEYHATLRVANDTPYGSLQVPVTMTVLPPTTWGKLEGTVTGLGYCDTNPAPLQEASVLVEGSTSLTWTVQTDAEGYYQLWLDEAHSPLTVTVVDPKHQTGQATEVVIVSTMTTTLDFDLRWLRPCVSTAPTSLEATVLRGTSEIRSLTLVNNGAADTPFDMQEKEGTVWPPKPGLVSGRGDWLYRAGQGVAMRTNRGETELAYPKAYRWQPDRRTSALNILVYADDFTHSAPSTFVDQALQALGLPYTAHYDGDFSGFAFDLTSGGPWDLVIFENATYDSAGTSFPEMLAYIQGGGNLAAEIWTMLWDNTDPLYAELGASYVANDAAAPPVYWWDTTHPIFTTPQSAPPWLSRGCPAYYSCGQYLDPVSGVSSALAGYTVDSAAGQGALILRNDGRTAYKGFADTTTSADADSDGILDGVELWINVIDGIQNGFSADVLWLSEKPMAGTVDADSTFPVEITFTAFPTMTAGIYTARVVARTDDGAHPTLGVPVTMTVVHAPACSFKSSSPDELGETTVFTNTTDEGLSQTTYQWNFGDGSPLSTEEHPEHSYVHPRLYEVVLTATNQWGQRQCRNTISIKGVEASFTSNSPVLLGHPVIFTNTTLSNPPVVQWFWTFGDSYSSEEENPVHTFAETGIYTVTLFAANLPYQTQGSVYDIYQAAVVVRIPINVYSPIVVRNY